MKKFLISIDTEGDNQWNYIPGKPIETRNVKAVYRFQELCNKYGFKPTYLTNYEMACNEEFVRYIRKEQEEGHCEVGMHLHGWNTPPEYTLEHMRSDIAPGDCSFLIEYPEDIMEKKISYMTDLLTEKFGRRPISHRAGRWATNDTYFEILDRYGYLVDCSVTPGMDMTSSVGFTEGSHGTDYRNYPKDSYRIPNLSLIEIPMTVRQNHKIKKDGRNGLKHYLYKCYKAYKGRGPIWLRPAGSNLDELLYLARKIKHEKTDYLMFMLHTSEMMAGCSPTFPTEESIERLFSDMEELFRYVSTFCVGATIGDYAREIKDSL